MNARTQAWLWFAQRASAALLGFFVLVHLATMIYAVRNGLSAGEILARQQIPLECGETLRLLPHVHDTDGFYAAVLERRKAAI